VPEVVEVHDEPDGTIRPMSLPSAEHNSVHARIHKAAAAQSSTTRANQPEQHKEAAAGSAVAKVQADVLEQLAKLAPLNERIAVRVGGLVRTHDRGLVIEVWTVHGLADLSTDNRLIDLRKREPTVAVDIDVVEELCAGGLVRHD
jgi:hypothetical protein